MAQHRIVTLIDMDCFYCQVEARADPSLKGKPLAVVQYNQWKGGGIIAVNYEARDKGVSRGTRGDEATKKCPDLKLVSVPEVRGKADLTRYRDAGREVIAVLCKFSSCVEKASIDEAYIDLTDEISKRNQRVTSKQLKNTFVVGYDSDEGQEQWLNDTYNSGMNDKLMRDLAQGAALVEEIRAAILEQTGFHCSAGISHNKILAKLACGLRKPNRQTVLPLASVPVLYEHLPLKKIRSLGGKFGDAVREQCGVTYMGEVVQYSLKELQQKFGDKNGLWLYNIARGIDSEMVKPRLVSKSIGCCKNFKGPDALTTKKDVQYWITELAAEIIERIRDDFVVNERKGTLLVVSAHQETNDSTPFSRSVPLNNYDPDEIVRNAITVLNRCNHASSDSPSWSPALKFLGLSVGKFVDMKDSGRSLRTFFKPIPKSKPSSAEESERSISKSEEGEQSKLATTPKPKADVVNESERSISRSENSEQSQFVTAPESKTGVANESEPANSETEEGAQLQVENTSDDEFADLKLEDYRDSFFCKYFYGKRLRLAENETRATKKAVDSSENPLPSSSNTEPVPSTSNSLDNPMPSTSREYDVRRSDNSALAELFETCSECQQRIPLIDFLEHLDHHVACRLQEELNSEPVVPNANTKPNVLDDSRTRNSISTLSKLSKLGTEKRKYKSSKTRSSPAKRPLQITTFFKRQVESASDK